MNSNQEVKEFFDQIRTRRQKRKNISYYSLLAFTVLLTVFLFSASEKSVDWSNDLDANIYDNSYGRWNIPLSIMSASIIIDCFAIVSLIIVSIYSLFLKDSALNKIVYTLVTIIGLFFIFHVAVGIMVTSARII